MLELVIEEVCLTTDQPLSRARSLTLRKAGTRFTEDELHDILAITQQVFDEEEGNIPAGVENMEMPKIANKLLGANKKRRKAKKKA